MKQNALELQNIDNVQDMPMTREQFQEAKQELENLQKSITEPSIFEGFDRVNYVPNLQLSQDQFQKAKKELENLQEFDINPLILDGLDRSLEELEKTVLESMSGDWKEQLGKSSDDWSNSKIQKTSNSDETSNSDGNNTEATMGGRRTKKRRNMRRNSKRKKPMRKKSMRKKSMRKKSMRRRRSSKKKY